MTYSGSGKVTFSHALGDELEGRRIVFGEADGKLCFTFMIRPDEPGLIVHKRQVSDSVLRRHAKTLERGTKLHFEFDTDSAFFIESRRERLGTPMTRMVRSERQENLAELQP